MPLDHLRSFNHVRFEDLSANFDNGWAYQTVVDDFDYGETYFQRYDDLESTEIARSLNNFRRDLAQKYASSVLDFGIGSGTFLKNVTVEKYGYDINPLGIQWLKENKLFLDPYQSDISQITGFSFWDVLEHMKNPNEILALLPQSSFSFITMPIYQSLLEIHESKHYKPNEHVCYFTMDGFINYLGLCDFEILEVSTKETKLGREGVVTFVCQKK